MIRGLLIGVGGFAVCLALAGCGREAQPTPGGGIAAPDFDKTLDPERHRFAQHRFSARFPKGFTRQPSPNPNAVVLVVNAARTANINIRVPPARPGDTLDDVLAEIRQGMMAQVENPVAGGEGEFTLGGFRCAWLQMTHGPPEKRVDAVAYLVKRPSDVVMVFGTTAAGEMAKHRAAFDDSVRSIEFE